MKKFSIMILTGIIIVNSVLVVNAADVDLSNLKTKELTLLKDELKDALELYHEPDEDVKDAVLSVVQNVVESYADEQNIEEISWAWFDYDYTRAWDFYTLDTHADFDEDEKDIYAELFPENGEYAVYYLLIGKDVIINCRNELPEELWVERPEAVVDAATGVDLSIVSEEELKALKDNINEEISENHTPESDVKKRILDLVKENVEQYYSKENSEVSWAWFDYDYKREWEFYSLNTPINYKKGNQSEEADVYAEAYPLNGEYELFYLSINDEVLIDNRNALPDSFIGNEEENPQQIKTEGEKENNKSVEENKVETEKKEENIKDTKSETETSVVVMEMGAKGVDVKEVQEILIALGYLSGNADGEFGKETKAAVEGFQSDFDFNVTGSITEEEMGILLLAEKSLSYNQEKESMSTEGILTVDNCPDLKEMINNKSEMSSAYGNFVSKYSGRTIRFDGFIADLANHKDYSTRYDVLIYCGSPTEITGPCFQFVDVNVYDMNISSDSIKENDNVTIEAKVKSYDSNTGLFRLDPVKVIVK